MSYSNPEILTELIPTISKLIETAGNILIKKINSVSGIREKNKHDYVSDVDQYIEKYLQDNLAELFPEIEFMGEEQTKTGQDFQKLHWVVDPLDGTTNYLHRFPVYTISVALKKDRDVLLGIVYNPVTHCLYHAVKEQGAFKDGKPIQVSSRNRFTGGLYATGFPFRNHLNIDRYLTSFKNVLLSSDGIRRCGSAALDLCMVAEGSLDGYWEDGLSRWDIAAGMLIIREAGGVVKDFNRLDFPQITGNVITSNPEIFSDFYQTAIIPYINFKTSED
jgi:myo-inositol-1(or 4)-monophosphatase